MLPTHSSQMHLHNCLWRIGNKTGYVILKFSSEFSLIINEGIILSFEPLNCLHLLKQIQYLYNALWFLPLPRFLIYFLFFHHLNYHRKWINASEDRRSLDPSECPWGMQVPGGAGAWVQCKFQMKQRRHQHLALSHSREWSNCWLLVLYVTQKPVCASC